MFTRLSTTQRAAHRGRPAVPVIVVLLAVVSGLHYIFQIASLMKDEEK